MIALEQAIETVNREFPKTAEYKRHHLSESVIEYAMEFESAYVMFYSEPESVAKAMKASGLPGCWYPPYPIVDKKTGEMTVSDFPYASIGFRGKPKFIDVEKRVA